jgi:hypothetical protein
MRSFNSTKNYFLLLAGKKFDAISNRIAREYFGVSRITEIVSCPYRGMFMLLRIFTGIVFLARLFS